MSRGTIVTNRCPFCGANNEVTVNSRQLMAWMVDNIPIQVAMPDLPTEDRETLISGICKPCQKKVFG